MRQMRCLPGGAALALLLLTAPPASARSEDPSIEREPISDSVHLLARRETDLGAPSADTWMEGLTLVLRPRAGTERALDRLLAEQQRPGSETYHRWVTPDEYGRLFGVADEELYDLVGWLEGRGVHVSEPPRGRGWLNLSGTVADLERAFATRIRRYATEETEELANATEIALPRRLARLVAPGTSLSTFRPRPLHRRVPIPPSADSGISRSPFANTPFVPHAMGPADFATIYNVAPLYARGITGKGVTIAILSTSNVNLDDVRRFRSYFGLPAKDPQVVVNGPDPGKAGAEGESDLDVEWSGAVAPDADVVLMLTGGTGDTLFISAQNAVNQNAASIISVSFGNCESAASRGWDAVWRQAAAQGISAFVASGDSGCSCDPFTSPMATGLAVNGLAASPFDTVVGGTQFSADVADPDTYWAATENAATHASALSYIPEAGFNESGGATHGAPLFAGGGGVSTLFTRQAFQDAPGAPAGSKRLLPDVALSAAVHDPYLIFAESDPNLAGVAGTSASTPAFAGIAALVQQAAGERLGNMGPRLYELARAQYAPGGGFPVFHDVVEGNNSVPGATGFECGAGYDLVTGLGSVDGAALASAWTPAAPAPCVPDPTALCLNGGRFRVAASWKNASTGESVSAHAVALSGDTGYFWFFSDNNIELVVKALDGRPVNGKYWVFYGALSNVEYSIVVTDTTTGLARSYFNPQGRLASVADVSAF